MYSLLLNYNKRSKNYLKIFKKNKIFFNYLIVCNIANKNNLKYPYSNKILTFRNKKIDFKILKILNSNKIKKIVISPGDGEIINKKFLKNREILHCHPGELPFFKGSGTIYYSILESKSVCCSIIKLNDKIDEGKVVFNKRFNLPDLKKINYVHYDNEIRAKTFVDFLRSKKKLKIKKIKDNFLPYYIPHPIIRYLCKNIGQKII